MDNSKIITKRWPLDLSLILSLIIIAILLGTYFIKEPELNQMRYTPEIPEIAFPEPETKEKDYLNFDCNELVSEFNSEISIEKALLITNIMALKECNIKEKCISDAKFEFYIREFNKGVISEEEFEEINEQYIAC